MKRLLVLLCLLAWPAQAQYREGTTQWLDFAGTAVATTDAVGSYVTQLRLVSSAAVYYAIAISGQAEIVAAEQATAHYLPANEERIVSVSPGSTVVAIQVSSSGTLFITELTQ